MTLHIQRAKVGFIVAVVAGLLALSPATASAQPFAFSWDSENGSTGSFSVSLSEARFSASGAIGSSTGFHGSRDGDFYEMELAMAPSTVSPLCREIDGVLSVDFVYALAGDVEFGTEFVMTMSGTICLDPNTGIISGEGLIEFISWAHFRTGAASEIHPASGTGTFRLQAELDDSGAAGTITLFEFSGRMEHPHPH